jgi:hypothetical protein
METVLGVTKVDAVIQYLNAIEVDGETMQYIIEKTNMQEQMLKQLILTYPADAIQVLSNEIEHMEWNA